MTAKFPTLKLVKRATDDGLVVVEDFVPDDRVYEVDPMSRTELRMFNVDRGVTHSKEMVKARVPGTTDWGWVATELLEPMKSDA